MGVLAGLEGTLSQPCKEQVEGGQAATSQGSPAMGTARPPACQGERLAPACSCGPGPRRVCIRAEGAPPSRRDVQ